MKVCLEGFADWGKRNNCVSKITRRDKGDRPVIPRIQTDSDFMLVLETAL